MRGFVGNITAGDGRGNDYRYQGREEQFGHEQARGDITPHPEHDGRYVADGRKGSAAVGRDDDNAGEDPSFFLFADHTPQQHDHNDRCGHVVQHGGHKEGDDR